MSKTKYGFHARETKVIMLFDAIPIYPTTTTSKELAEKLNLTISVIDGLLWRLPVAAPVIQDFGIISRVK